MSCCADVVQPLQPLLQLGREAGCAGLRIQGSVAPLGAGWACWAAPFPLMGALPAPRDLPAGPPRAASAHCPDVLPVGVD